MTEPNKMDRMLQRIDYALLQWEQTKKRIGMVGEVLEKTVAEGIEIIQEERRKKYADKSTD